MRQQGNSVFDLLSRLEDATTMLTIGQVAEIFQVSDKTIRRMINKREIPSILVGSHRRFDPGTLRWWAIKRSPEMGKASVESMKKAA